MTTEQKTDLYNRISSMKLEDAIKFAASLYKEGKGEEGDFVVADNMKRRKAQQDLKAGKW